MFEPRFYRNNMGKERFDSFSIAYKETDLWIGLNRVFEKKYIPAYVQWYIINSRKTIEDYSRENPEFLTSLSPIDVARTGDELVVKMADFGRKADVGPMASVAGVIAHKTGEILKKKFNPREIVIENGGDIYLDISEPLTVSIYAGESQLSGKIGLKICPRYSPLGICTSSGTVGPSYSSGKADAVVIACKETGLADAYATSYCNRVKNTEDIDKVLDELKSNDDILASVIVMGDRMGISGSFGLQLYDS